VEGAFVGLLGWAVVGAVVGAVLGTILGAVLGAMLGAVVGAVLGVLLVGMVTGAQGKLIPTILTDGVAVYFIEDSNVQPLDQDFAVISVEAHALADGMNVEMKLGRFDVAQALAIGQLGKGHAEILLEAGKALDLALPAIARDASAKRRQRHMLRDLREHQLASVHRCPPRVSFSQDRNSTRRASNRDQEKS
jgi:hypothetical protein